MKAFWRGLLAVAFLFATQTAIVHPFGHFEDRVQAASAAAAVDPQHPFELSHSKQCDVCTAAVSLQGIVTGSIHLSAESSSAMAPSKDSAAFIAAFKPLFRSQAPPAFL